MNVYDFDDTIYRGDTGIHWILFALRKRPLFMMWHLIKFSRYAILYQFHKIDFKVMKEKLFSFFPQLPNLPELVNEFVAKNQNNIKSYYQNVRKEDDLIISASFDFYLLPLCKAMGISHVICTRYDIKTGKIIGENCKREEKVRRLEEVYGKEVVVENAYGDSKNDIPLLKRAQHGFVVKGETVVPYEEGKSFW